MAWTVAVSDGWVTDPNGKYVREAIKIECGHSHKTEAAAEACMSRLQRVSGSGSNRHSSAVWHEAIVLRDGKSR